jgi:hypothetical protein
MRGDDQLRSTGGLWVRARRIGSRWYKLWSMHQFVPPPMNKPVWSKTLQHDTWWVVRVYKKREGASMDRWSGRITGGHAGEGMSFIQRTAGCTGRGWFSRLLPQNPPPKWKRVFRGTYLAKAWGRSDCSPRACRFFLGPLVSNEWRWAYQRPGQFFHRAALRVRSCVLTEDCRICASRCCNKKFFSTITILRWVLCSGEFQESNALIWYDTHKTKIRETGKGGAKET